MSQETQHGYHTTRRKDLAISIALMNWIVTGLTLMTFALFWRNGRMSARLGELARDIADQAQRHRDELAKMADQFKLQLDQAQRESGKDIATIRSEWANVRQRWQLTASQFLIAKEWIRLLLVALVDAGIKIPIPPNIEEMNTGRADESAHFAELDIIAEERLDTLIEQAATHNEGLEGLNG